MAHVYGFVEAGQWKPLGQFEFGVPDVGMWVTWREGDPGELLTAKVIRRELRLTGHLFGKRGEEVRYHVTRPVKWEKAAEEWTGEVVVEPPAEKKTEPAARRGKGRAKAK